MTSEEQRPRILKSTGLGGTEEVGSRAAQVIFQSSGRSRLRGWFSRTLWVIVAGNLVVILSFEVGTTLLSVNGRPLSPAIAVAIAGTSGLVAGWLLVLLRGGAVALAVLSVLIIVEASFMMELLSHVGRGYGSWLAPSVAAAGAELRWAGLACGLGAAISGRIASRRVAASTGVAR